MSQLDTAYYRDRANTERKLALAAERQDVAAIHQELARLYQALVDQKAAAKLLGLTNHKTLAVWRVTRRHADLPYLKIGRTVRYRVGDLIAFRLQKTRS